MLGGIKQKKCIIHCSAKMISFVLFPQASVPSLNFNKSFSDDFVSKNSAQIQNFTISWHFRKVNLVVCSVS